LGCLVALLLDDARWQALTKRYFTWIPWSLCAVGYVLFTIIPRQHLYTVWESMLLPMMVAGTVMHPSSVISRVLENGILRWIGRLSYSLYLWQQLFALDNGRGAFRFLQQFPLNLALTLLCAFLSYELVERPLIRLGHRLSPPPTPGRGDIGLPLAVPESEKK
jgi:peptidoglycan/LPS O-acetylase OafA/YrhL